MPAQPHPFNDIVDDDAYCPGDPDPTEVNWDEVATLQSLIDALPTEPIARQMEIAKIIKDLEG